MHDRDDLVFPMAEFERRLSELRDRMSQRGVDALLTTTPENITYLTGFESPGHYWFQGLIVPLEGEAVTVSRVLEQAGVDAYTWIERNVGYHDSEDAMERVAETLRGEGLDGKRIGFEKDCWFFTAGQQERLFAKLPSTTFIDVGGIVEQGRVRKSAPELALMREASRAAEAGMRAGVNAVSGGATPTASVRLRVDGEERVASGTGSGPVDAALNAVREALDDAVFRLNSYHVDAVTGGTDALVTVEVALSRGDRSVSVAAREADITKASVRAMVDGLDRLLDGVVEEALADD
jgi:hypothetical protein